MRDGSEPWAHPGRAAMEKKQMIDWNGALVTSAQQRCVRVVGTVNLPEGLRYVLAAQMGEGRENLLMCDERGFSDNTGRLIVRNAGRVKLTIQQIRRGLSELDELVETFHPNSAMRLEDGGTVDYVDVLRQAQDALASVS